MSIEYRTILIDEGDFEYCYYKKEDVISKLKQLDVEILEWYSTIVVIPDSQRFHETEILDFIRSEKIYLDAAYIQCSNSAWELKKVY
ncbi:MAG TPA: hypothetical protein VLH56_11270 [Dissulfurispiraceae bacterium]|nr:hypothetical protein [Dissulfurispiraceae bacterium]